MVRSLAQEWWREAARTLGAAVGRGVGIGVAVGEDSGLNEGVAIGAEAAVVAGPSVAAGSKSSQAMPTVTAIDRTPAMRNRA